MYAQKWKPRIRHRIDQAFYQWPLIDCDFIILATKGHNPYFVTGCAHACNSITIKTCTVYGICCSEFAFGGLNAYFVRALLDSSDRGAAVNFSTSRRIISAYFCATRE